MDKIFTAIIILFAINISANERIRIYDSENKLEYKGYVEKKFKDWRFYDKKGRYVGKCNNKRCYDKDGSTSRIIRF